MHDDSKKDIITTIESNVDIIYIWSKLMEEIDEHEAKILLIKIINLYFTVRGFSFAKSVVEMYKLKVKKGLQKKQGLRKNI